VQSVQLFNESMNKGANGWMDRSDRTQNKTKRHTKRAHTRHTNKAHLEHAHTIETNRKSKSIWKWKEMMENRKKKKSSAMNQHDEHVCASCWEHCGCSKLSLCEHMTCMCRVAWVVVFCLELIQVVHELCGEQLMVQ
jgi:hypothetical protein